MDDQLTRYHFDVFNGLQGADVAVDPVTKKLFLQALYGFHPAYVQIAAHLGSLTPSMCRAYARFPRWHGWVNQQIIPESIPAIAMQSSKPTSAAPQPAQIRNHSAQHYSTHQNASSRHVPAASEACNRTVVGPLQIRPSAPKQIALHIDSSRQVLPKTSKTVVCDSSDRGCTASSTTQPTTMTQPTAPTRRRNCNSVRLSLPQAGEMATACLERHYEMGDYHLAGTAQAFADQVLDVIAAPLIAPSASRPASMALQEGPQESEGDQEVELEEPYHNSGYVAGSSPDAQVSTPEPVTDQPNIDETESQEVDVEEPHPDSDYDGGSSPDAQVSTRESVTDQPNIDETESLSEWNGETADFTQDDPQSAEEEADESSSEH